jgi:putative oxidoreductase
MSLIHWLLSILREWEWIGILLARLAVGTLFVLSGTGKLFRANKRELMIQTLRNAEIPWPEFNARLVSAIETLCGGFVLIGFLTPLACVLLCGVMIVALVTVRLKSMDCKSASDCLSEFLYLPEVLYIVILVWLFFSGPGRLSLDYLLS